MSKKVENIEQLKKASETANTYAKTRGKENIGEIINPIQEGLKSDNKVLREISMEQARGVVTDLTKLILRQEIFTTPDAPYLDFVNAFNDGVVNEGNGKLYDFNNPTGADTFQETQFIPSEHTTTDVDQYTIQMYGSGKQLSAQGYQFRKSLVYSESQWIPYFKMGNLTGFIAQLQANVEKTWRMYIFDKIVRKLKSSSSTQMKVINGTATDAFSAWSQEILPEIRKMTTLSSDYTYTKANTNLMSTNPKDLIILANPKTIQTLQSGIKSQLFNAKLLDLEGLVSTENFIDCGRELTIGGPTQKVSAGNTYYIPENEIYVISKDAFKHFKQIESVGSQYFPLNLSIEFVVHIWGAMDYLPWGQVFKYTNQNLNTLP